MKRPNKNRIDKEGVCPKCGADLEYGTKDEGETVVEWHWDCPKCKAVGMEVHVLTFAHHLVAGEDNAY